MPKPLLHSPSEVPLPWGALCLRRSWCSTLGHWIGALLVLLAAGEIASRIDDAVFSDIALLASPDRAYDLTTVENGLPRGRPGGSFRKWQLNNHGFPGPDIALAPTGPRVMLLGASETFGLYESKGKTYGDRLALAVGHARPGVEIVNAAMPGMTARSIEQYWRGYASRYRPSLVLIYASPEFYLDIEVPRGMSGPALPPEKPPLLSSRFSDRLHGQIRQVEFLRALRARFVVGTAVTEGGPGYLFDAAALAERLAAFSRDIEALGHAIAQTGATPVLVTYAFKSRDRVDPRDRNELDYFRIFYPRAEPQTFLAFSASARQAVLDVARRAGWPAIDAADALSGQRELFEDPVHFNDKGSQRMADVLAPKVLELIERHGGPRAVQ